MFRYIMGLELSKQIVWSLLKDLGATKKKVSLSIVHESLDLPNEEVDVLIEDLQLEGLILRPTEKTVKLFY